MTCAYLQYLLGNAALASCLILLLLGTQRFLRNPSVRHTLWLLVLLQLLVPPFVRIPLPFLPQDVLGSSPSRLVDEPPSQPLVALPTPLLEQHATSPDLLPQRAELIPTETAEPQAFPGARQSRSNPQPEAQPEAPAPAIDIEALRLLAEDALRALAHEESLLGPLPTPTPTPSTPDPVPFPELLAGLLALGSLFFALRATFAVQHFSGTLRCAEPAPASLVARANELGRRLGLRRIPEVRIVPATIPPMLWSPFGRSRILLPRRLLDAGSSASLDALLAHELAHFARGDGHVRRIETVAQILFWWFPLLPLARRALRRDEEIACDQRALSTLPARRLYAEALVDAAAFVSSRRLTLAPLASGAAPVHDLQRRLEMIFDPRSRFLASRARWALLALGSLSLPLAPGFAQSSPAAEPEVVQSPTEPSPAAKSAPALPSCDEPEVVELVEEEEVEVAEPAEEELVEEVEVAEPAPKSTFFNLFPGAFKSRGTQNPQADERAELEKRLHEIEKQRAELRRRLEAFVDARSRSKSSRGHATGRGEGTLHRVLAKDRLNTELNSIRKQLQDSQLQLSRAVESSNARHRSIRAYRKALQSRERTLAQHRKNLAEAGPEALRDNEERLERIEAQVAELRDKIAQLERIKSDHNVKALAQKVSSLRKQYETRRKQLSVYTLNRQLPNTGATAFPPLVSRLYGTARPKVASPFLQMQWSPHSNSMLAQAKQLQKQAKKLDEQGMEQAAHALRSAAKSLEAAGKKLATQLRATGQEVRHTRNAPQPSGPYSLRKNDRGGQSEIRELKQMLKDMAARLERLESRRDREDVRERRETGRRR